MACIVGAPGLLKGRARGGAPEVLFGLPSREEQDEDIKARGEREHSPPEEEKEVPYV